MPTKAAGLQSYGYVATDEHVNIHPTCASLSISRHSLTVQLVPMHKKASQHPNVDLQI